MTADVLNERTNPIPRETRKYPAIVLGVDFSSVSSSVNCMKLCSVILSFFLSVGRSQLPITFVRHSINC